MLEREFRAGDRDLVIAETDLADDETDIGFPKNGIVGLKLFAKHIPEAIDDFGRDAALALFHLPLEAFDRIVQRGHFGAMLSETLGDGGIARRHEPCLDEFHQLANSGFGPSTFGARLLEIVRSAFIGLVRSLKHMAQQFAEAEGLKNALFHCFEDDFVELFFTDAFAGTTARGPIRLGVARVIAVPATFARADRQSMVAAGHVANGHASEQRTSVRDPRRSLCRRGLCAGRSDDFGFLGLDDAGAFNPDPVLGSGDATVIVGSFVRIGSSVMRPRQNAVDRGMKEGIATHRIAVGCEPFGYGPRPHWLAAEAMAGQSVDTANDSGLMLDDRELLAFLVTLNRGGFGLVAVGHGAAVPIARARVGPTITPRKQRRVIGIFFVHDRNHGTHHLAVRARPKILGD
ncbi:hypothetical protein OVY29_01120 [Sphingopyxis sp. SE2]|nr:hypothetical protein [Sphingopyxis sp. SE2]MDT7527267.1 hypothetical protein [Sphingopyxis sp. SE2]